MIIHTEDFMANTQTLIAEVYSAFNQRNIDGALALMRESVSWPKASEGGRVVGKEEIRAYWSCQWKEFDPHVEPIEVIDRGAGKIDGVLQLSESPFLMVKRSKAAGRAKPSTGGARKPPSVVTYAARPCSVAPLAQTRLEGPIS
jgi:hypothetical protein